MPDFKEHLKEFKKKYPDKIVFEISAVMNEGIDELMKYVADTLDNIDDNPIYEDSEFESHMVFKFKNDKPYTIEKEEDTWVITGDEIEKLFKMTRFNEDEASA